ncbi:MAG: hypothetical protein IJF79_01645 [Clostridia bacterium]|nr:hypothetical protein [Clostridia bacterium]
MKFICTCRSNLDAQAAFALDLKRYDFAVEIEAVSQEEAFEIFKLTYIQDLDLSDASVTISVNLK